jgi:hypothetical protein
MSRMRCLTVLAAAIPLTLSAAPRERQATPPSSNASQQAANASNAPKADSPADAWPILMQGATSGNFRDRSDAISA